MPRPKTRDATGAERAIRWHLAKQKDATTDAERLWLACEFLVAACRRAEGKMPPDKLHLRITDAVSDLNWRARSVLNQVAKPPRSSALNRRRRSA